MIVKWDGASDADKILEALMPLIDDEDLKLAKTTSYGDFGKYLQKHYRSCGAGNSQYSAIGNGSKLHVTLKQRNITYEMTWNKAAKLLHSSLMKGAII